MSSAATEDGRKERPSGTAGGSGLWRDLTAFWILGLCNNYGYVVMLSAAHDIIGTFEDDEDGQEDSSTPEEGKRYCQMVSTGAILLADVLPSLVVKLIVPFLPFNADVNIILAILLSAGGFILVAFATAPWMAILGVVVTSMSSGIGETTFLAYSSNFDKNVVSTWSSGTGGAGVIGSTAYAGLMALGLGPRTTLLLMLVVPSIESVTFWILLRKPMQAPPAIVEPAEGEKPLHTFREKFFYIRELLKYMVPLVLVYFFEYFINQGMFELVYFEDTFLDKPAQYRWLNVDYQIGVFISRSSVNLVQIDRLYLMAIFQGVNAVYFLTEVIFYYTPNIWIVYTVVLWEGLLGGSAYVNTFYKMTKEIPPDRRRFALSVVVISDSLGVAWAGFTAIPVHNAICKLPPSKRPWTF